METTMIVLRALRVLVCSSFVLVQVALAQEAPKYHYVFPKPNSQLVSKGTNIIVRSGKKIDRTSLISSSIFVVVGTKSGFHEGLTVLSDDEKTIVFNPLVPFVDDERVAVTVSDGLRDPDGAAIPGISFEFTTALSAPLPDLPETVDESRDAIGQTIPPTRASASAILDSIPSDFPGIKIDTLNNPASGEIFIADFATPGKPFPYGNYVMILDNGGKPVAYKKIGSAMNAIAYVFKAESNGLFSYIERTPVQTTVRLIDTTMNVVDSYTNPNPTSMIHGDFVPLSNGHALVLYFDTKIIDMSKIVKGGNPAASVMGALIQEFDIKKNVVFQWSSFDYLPITDTFGDTLAAAIDYAHTNAVEPDNDGNLLISNRAMSDIVKIDRNTGEIIWRLGGKRNQFTFLGEHPENNPLYFTNQHNIKRLPNGNVTLFDNGNLHKPQYSRAVEYRLDEVNRTATLVWEYRHTPDLYASANGSVQRLPNGNTFIGWGDVGLDGKTSLTEVHSDNSIAFELTLSAGYRSMRAYRFPWKTGTPAGELTIHDLLQGNTYSFNDTSRTGRTGVRMKLNVLTPFSYNRATVQRFTTAPSKPQFIGRAPWMAPQRVTMSQLGMLSVNADFYFDVTQFSGLPNPSAVTVYQRDTVGSGVFSPLQTSYNSVTKEIVANTSEFGEFVFCWDDSDSSASPPITISPANRDSVNQLLSVAFRWNPRGYVTGYHLQVALDSLFQSMIMNDSLLTTASDTLKSVVPKSRYYWRVRAKNYNLTSKWSQVQSFTATAPYVSVSSPNGNESWQRGYQYFIKWSTNIKDAVRIDLLKGSKPVTMIKDSVVNVGAYAWTIPSTMTPDSTFKIRIRSVADSSVFGTSSATFAITSVATGIEKPSEVPKDFALHQNYPNPFNPSTAISYQLTTSSFVRLEVFDVLGRKVAEPVSKEQTAGVHIVRWDASGIPSGIYLYRLTAGSFLSVRKMVLMK